MINETVDLYEYFGVPRGENAGGILTSYVPYATHEVSAKKRPAMIVFPGGGYWMLSDREKEPVALRFLSKGYSAFTLQYAVHTAYPVPLVEACMAVAYIRENAQKYSVDEEHIAAVGFSAGGHLAAMLATMFAEKEVKAVLGERNARPDAVILSYPVITADPRFWHEGSIRTISGDGRKTCGKAFRGKARYEEQRARLYLAHRGGRRRSRGKRPADGAGIPRRGRVV